MRPTTILLVSALIATSLAALPSAVASGCEEGAAGYTFRCEGGVPTCAEDSHISAGFCDQSSPQEIPLTDCTYAGGLPEDVTCDEGLQLPIPQPTWRECLGDVPIHMPDLCTGISGRLWTPVTSCEWHDNFLPRSSDCDGGGYLDLIYIYCEWEGTVPHTRHCVLY